MKTFQISEEKINQLAKRISDQIIQQKASLPQTIDGETLTHFSNHPQFNKFLLFQVYQVWQLQISRFKHPYFDFSHQEIGNKLQELQNLLSRHIAIRDEEFRPLFQKAVYNNLKLIFMPEEALLNFFFPKGDKVSLSLFKQYTPFFSDFDFLVNSVQRYHEKHDIHTVDRDVFLSKAERIAELFENKKGISVADYQKAIIQKLCGQSVEEIMEEDQAEAISRKNVQQQSLEETRLEAERKVEEEKRRAVQEKLAEAEAASKAEEEQQRKVAKLEVQHAEEARLSNSFFDDLKSDADFLDLEEDDVNISAEKEAARTIETVQEVTEPEEEGSVQAAIESKIEEQPQSILDRFKDQQEETAEPQLIVSEEEVQPSILDVLSKDKVEIEVPELPDFVEEKVTEIPALESPEAIEEELPALVEPEPEPEPEPIQQVVETVVEEDSSAIVASIAPQKEEAVSILDRFKQTQEESDSANSKSGKIQLDDIPIHKQYQYVQKVFGGNNVRFRIIIDKVNNSSDRTELNGIVDKYVLNDSELDRNEPTLVEFLALLRGRH